MGTGAPGGTHATVLGLGRGLPRQVRLLGPRRGARGDRGRRRARGAQARVRHRPGQLPELGPADRDRQRRVPGPVRRPGDAHALHRRSRQGRRRPLHRRQPGPVRRHREHATGRVVPRRRGPLRSRCDPPHRGGVDRATHHAARPDDGGPRPRRAGRSGVQRADRHPEQRRERHPARRGGPGVRGREHRGRGRPRRGLGQDASSASPPRSPTGPPCRTRSGCGSCSSTTPGTFAPRCAPSSSSRPAWRPRSRTRRTPRWSCGCAATSRSSTRARTPPWSSRSWTGASGRTSPPSPPARRSS